MKRLIEEIDLTLAQQEQLRQIRAINHHEEFIDLPIFDEVEDLRGNFMYTSFMRGHLDIVKKVCEILHVTPSVIRIEGDKDERFEKVLEIKNVRKGKFQETLKSRGVSVRPLSWEEFDALNNVFVSTNEYYEYICVETNIPYAYRIHA